MEKRKITIVSDKKTSPVTIESSAETLGELKRELSNIGIDYNNSTFTEGNSAVRLINDNSELPLQVKRRLTGEMTNHLVISIKTINKRLNQGARQTGEYHRTVINAIVKVNPELKQMIIDEFGCNYTQVSSKDLSEFLNNNSYTNENTPKGKIEKDFDINVLKVSDKDKFVSSTSIPEPEKKDNNASNNGNGKIVSDKSGKPENKEGKKEVCKSETNSGSDSEAVTRGAKSFDEYTEEVIKHVKTFSEEQRNDFLNRINRELAENYYSDSELRDILNSIDI